MEVVQVADCEFWLWDSFAHSGGVCDLDGESGGGRRRLPFHPLLHEAERERRVRETIVPPHTRRFLVRDCPSSVRFFSLPVPRTLAADCPRPPILPHLPTPAVRFWVEGL